MENYEKNDWTGRQVVFTSNLESVGSQAQTVQSGHSSSCASPNPAAPDQITIFVDQKRIKDFDVNTMQSKCSMKTLRVVCTLGLATAILAGCASAPCQHYNRLQVATFAGSGPKKPYGSAQVFEKAEDIKQPYTVIGMVSCEGNTGEEAGILNAMLYRACDMGGDGVLLGGHRIGAEDLSDSANTKIDFRSGWATLIGSGNSNRRAYRAQIIKFKN